jgi:peptide/nickel transport system substrate-binding protein
MRAVKSLVACVFVAAGLFVVLPANAQKAKDSLRISVNDPFPSLSPYHYSVDEAVSFYRQVYERLLDFDERKQQFVPRLAKSWSRVNPTTLEFELREGITFHNGNKFDADDVVTLIDYIRDPKAKTRSPQRYTWVKNVEKLGPYKVRIEAEAVNALDVGYLTYFFAIYDGESLNSLEAKELYGKNTPYGTGPYKVTELDTNRGITVERFDGYAGDRQYMRAPVKQIRGIPIPDRQTQIAQLLTGGIDMVRNVSPEAAEELKSNPALGVTNMPSADMLIFGLDATGESGAKPLMDPRVRRAIWMAIDRDKLIKHIVPGGEAADKMKGMCFTEHNLACSITLPPVEHDLEGAKRLLAEAGYPNGFEMSYDVFAPIKQVGEAIAGDLLKVGIRAPVQAMPISIYTQRRTKGEQQAYSIFYPTALFPDAGNILENYFYGRGDASKDPLIHQAVEEGGREFDLGKRAKIYERAFNRNNEMNYIMAVSSMPTVYAHSKDVRIDANTLSRAGNTIGDFFWK